MNPSMSLSDILPKSCSFTLLCQCFRGSPRLWLLTNGFPCCCRFRGRWAGSCCSCFDCVLGWCCCCCCCLGRGCCCCCSCCCLRSCCSSSCLLKCGCCCLDCGWTCFTARRFDRDPLTKDSRLNLVDFLRLPIPPLFPNYSRHVCRCRYIFLYIFTLLKNSWYVISHV